MDVKNHCGCDETIYDTQVKTINVQRDVYCKEMYVTLGDVSKLQIKRTSLKELIRKKNCWFIWTERHYRIYRNLDLTVGIKLLQTNDSIKEGVRNYLAVNKTLSESLKKIFKTVKEVKTRVTDFRDMACKLKICMEDPCNCSQMIELTGDVPANCKDVKPPPKKLPSPECDHIKEDLEKLVKMPTYLWFDMNSIFKSSSDVVGIQTFSNITTLDPLQAELGERIKKVEKTIQDVIKRQEGDLKSVLDDISKTQKDFAKTEVELYGKRTDFQGILDTVGYFCCPECGCIKTGRGDLERRLEDCEFEICDICKKEINKTKTEVRSEAEAE